MFTERHAIVYLNRIGLPLALSAAVVAGCTSHAPTGSSKPHASASPSACDGVTDATVSMNSYLVSLSGPTAPPISPSAMNRVIASMADIYKANRPLVSAEVTADVARANRDSPVARTAASSGAIALHGALKEAGLDEHSITINWGVGVEDNMSTSQGKVSVVVESINCPPMASQG